MKLKRDLSTSERNALDCAAVAPLTRKREGWYTPEQRFFALITITYLRRRKLLRLSEDRMSASITDAGQMVAGLTDAA